MQKYVNLIASLQKLISEEHVFVIMEFSYWVQLKKILYQGTTAHSLDPPFIMLTGMKSGLFTKRHKLVHNGKFPKFEVL